MLYKLKYQRVIIIQQTLIIKIILITYLFYCFYVLMFYCRWWVGTVFQTAVLVLALIPRLRPGLLSLRSVLPSRQRLFVRSVESVVE